MKITQDKHQIAFSPEQNLFILKKVLISKKSILDGFSIFAFDQLKVKDFSLNLLCYAVWNFHAEHMLDFGMNTKPDDIILAKEENDIFYMNWELIKKLDADQKQIDNYCMFNLELLPEHFEKIEKYLDMILDDYKEDTSSIQILNHATDVQIENCFSYPKQKEIILGHISQLYKTYLNETVVVFPNRMSEHTNENLNLFFGCLCMEKEGYWQIKGISNGRKIWLDPYKPSITLNLSKKTLSLFKNGMVEKVKTASAIRTIDPRLAKFEKNRLIFNQENGQYAHKSHGARTRSGTKIYALLNFLNEGKNTKWKLDEIIKNCNKHVSVEAHRFIKNKDVSDTIWRIKKNLKAEEEVTFPIRKGVNDSEEVIWVWYEK